QNLYGIEGVGLETLNNVRIERFNPGRDAKSTVIHMPAGATGDLSQLRWRQITVVLTVKLAHGGKRNVIDVQVETHTDSIGRHQEIHIARLIEFHLRITRTRRKSTENDRRAPTLPPDQLRDRINFAGRKRHHRRTSWQAGNFLFTCISEL